MHFSRASAPIASRISRLMWLLLHQVGTVDVGVGDLDDSGVGGQDDLVVVCADQLAGEGLATIVIAPRPHASAAADVAAEVVVLGERPLAARRRALQRLAISRRSDLVVDALAELE